MASTRLRRTFQYPAEDDASTGSRDELDEEEQEQIITQLEDQSLTTNTIYTLVFTLLPLCMIPIFAYHLIFSFSISKIRILSLLSITSLLGSSFMMFFMSSLAVTDARDRLSQRRRQTTRATMSTRTTAATALSRIKEVYTIILDKLDDIRMDLDVDGPLLKSLPILNAAINALLLFSAWLMKGSGRRSSGVPEFMSVYLLIPAVMFAMVEVGRRSIIDEQKELGNLKRLKYVYKGA